MESDREGLDSRPHRLHRCSSATPCRGHIPLLLHLLWPTRDLAFAEHKAEAQEASRFVAQLRKLNAGWTFRVWTDDECDSLMATAMPERLRAWRGLTPRMKRFDAIRPLILHVHGGLYLDVDVDCSRPLAPLLADPSTALVLRADFHGSAPPPAYRRALGIASRDVVATGNMVMGSIARHPLWLYYLDAIFDAPPRNTSQAGTSVVGHTGSGGLERAVLAFLAAHPAQRRSLRLLTSAEFQNAPRAPAACPSPPCDRLFCRHVHSLSPVEAQPKGDDDAAPQLSDSHRRNLAHWRPRRPREAPRGAAAFRAREAHAANRLRVAHM